MYKIQRATQTKEERIATRIAQTLTDFTIDVEAVGRFLATAVPHLLYTRVIEVLESAKFQKETDTEYDQRWGYRDDIVKK
jgi:2'-5' RNA ligase